MYQDLSSVRIPSGFSGSNKARVQVWYIVWFWLFRPSPHAANRFRLWLLKIFGANVHDTVRFRPSAFVSYPWNLVVGAHSYVGDNVFIDSLGIISIGSNVSISNGVFVTAGTHDYVSKDFDLRVCEVHLESETWIAARSVVLPGARLGKGSILAANSTLSAATGEGEIWGGSPARYLKPRVQKQLESSTTTLNGTV